MSGAVRALLGALGSLPDDTLRGLSRALFARSWRRFEAACDAPREAQTARLRALLRRHASTEFGQAHGFNAIEDWSGFRARVPVRDFEALRPWLDRVVGGADNVLVPARPQFYGRSSGTTGSPKMIPVGAAYRDEFRRPRRVWARQVMQAFPGLLRGRVLTVHSPSVEGYAEEVPYGSVSVGLSMRRDPKAALRNGPLDAVPRAVYTLRDFELKYHLTVRLAAAQPVSLAAAINPSTLVLLAKTLERDASAIAEEVELGTYRHLNALPPEVAEAIQPWLRPNPAAAARLRLATAGPRLHAPTLWPRLTGLVCWKGGSAPFYLEQLQRWFPRLPVMDFGYLATEGNFAFPLAPDAKGSVVAVTGHVLEFVPSDEAEDGEFSGARLADALEPGRRYRVVVSGSHGLFRYDMQDVVECTGFHRRTAEIAFVHKSGLMTSVTGEKLAEAHVVAAAARVAARKQPRFEGFSVAARLEDPPRYAWALELEAQPSADEASELAEALDRALAAENIEYEAKRRSLRLGPPEILYVRKGAFAAERARRVAAGAPDAHVKPPHLSRTWALMDRLEARPVPVSRRVS